LHRLETATLAYLDSGPNGSIVAERDSNDSTRGRLRFKVLHQPPLKLAAISGDIVHNLRSALDYFVEELVKGNGHTPSFQHLFPICAKPNDFSSAIGKGRLNGVSKRAMGAIEGFQPYNVKPEAQHRHPLLHLHTLSNRDKHHMLAISALNAAFVWQFVAPDGRVLQSNRTTEAIQDGGILAEIPVDFVIDGTKVELQSQVEIRVGFNEPAFANFDVAGALQNIREFIGMFMLPAFATFFDPLPDDLQLTSHGLGSPRELTGHPIVMLPFPHSSILFPR
jgi:hypothetical protein